MGLSHSREGLVIILTPKKELINEVWIQTRTDGIVSRRFFTGYWSSKMDKEDISKYISSNHSLIVKMITGSALCFDSKIDIVFIPRYIEKGIIFESTSEYENFATTGLTPEELYEYSEFVEGI